MNNADTKRLIEALSSNWQAEMRGYHTYNALSQEENEPQRSRALRNLALAEKHHADLWAGRLTGLGAPVPEYKGSESGEAGSLANRIGGPELSLRRLELEESRDIAHYGKQIRELGDEPSVAILKEVLADEADHYLILRRTDPPPPPRHWTRRWRNKRSTNWWPREKRANPRLPTGSATQSTESTTVWARFLALCREFRAQLSATAISC